MGKESRNWHELVVLWHAMSVLYTIMPKAKFEAKVSSSTPPPFTYYSFAATIGLIVQPQIPSSMTTKNMALDHHLAEFDDVLDNNSNRVRRKAIGDPMLGDGVRYDHKDPQRWTEQQRENT
jgi:hypothetical protein